MRLKGKNNMKNTKENVIKLLEVMEKDAIDMGRSKDSLLDLEDYLAEANAYCIARRILEDEKYFNYMAKRLKMEANDK